MTTNPVVSHAPGEISETRPVRLGMIVPSSNTCLEPQSYRMLAGREDVTMHSTRIPVTRIALDGGSDKQFETQTMADAAALLASADTDVIAWNGTSGSWLGIEHDQQIATVITEATGVPATTSTLAYMEAFKRFGLKHIALLTPYTQDVNEQIAASYADQGIQIVGSHHWSLSDNESFARVRAEDLLEPSRRLLEEKPDALIYLCTNLYGAPAVAQLEEEFGIPVLDSVAVTLWHALLLAQAQLLDTSWGKLLSAKQNA
ncbi:aspartate/glutamate racemase family protein [Glutamicibacter sp.]|uniref:maleate cis-trans isomerase family protein n=1 Tax=Glutamicibacter sp. TaxID=1931995 RepID=UPI0028BE5957|nr:aspartate/glutamate racemase family protein [Glutamicibacter sp.]